MPMTSKMQCLRCSNSFKIVYKSAIRPVLNSSLAPAAKRTFSSLPSLRPTIFPSTLRPSLINSSTPAVSSTGATAEAPLDLLPKISAHPALQSLQVRCGPRNTFDPSHFVRKRRHGFLSRLRTKKGRNLLKRRRAKRRSTLSH